jgi:UPF0176 protein
VMLELVNVMLETGLMAFFLLNEMESIDLTGRRCPVGASDPVGLSCSGTCKGTILLFYKYAKIVDPDTTAKGLLNLSVLLNLRGKLRISKEGVNISIAGSIPSILQFRSRIVELVDILNDIDPNDDSFFKPSSGCIHCFTDLSIKVVDEICPFGSNPDSMREFGQPHDTIHGLSPSDFHRELSRQDDDTLVLDVRNYYER